MKQNALEFLRKHSTLSLDSSNFLEVPRYNPNSVTTNPSLILKSLEKEEYRKLIKNLTTTFRHHTATEVLNQLLVYFGSEIAKLISGNVSVELNANLAFTIGSSLRQVESIMKLSNLVGIGRRILIKIPATWEGIQVCKTISKCAVRCNMTLVFSLIQSTLCQMAKAHTISPFVGRITDHYRSQTNAVTAKNERLDPGILLLKTIWKHCERQRATTKIMAASFRNVQQVLSVVGCDFVTVSPNLIDDLRSSDQQPAAPNLEVTIDGASQVEAKMAEKRSNFYRILRQNRPASCQLLRGIAKFTRDSTKLTSILRNLQIGEQPQQPSC